MHIPNKQNASSRVMLACEKHPALCAMLTYVFSTKTTFLVETATSLMRTKVCLYGPKPSKYINIRPNYHRMMHQDASYVFSTNIQASSTTKLNLLTRTTRAVSNTPWCVGVCV